MIFEKFVILKIRNFEKAVIFEKFVILKIRNFEKNRDFEKTVILKIRNFEKTVICPILKDIGYAFEESRDF